MLIFLFVAVIATVLYLVFKVLLPEMGKPALSPKVQVYDPVEFNQVDGPDKRIEKLENLVAEKNKNVQLLQTELKILQVQVYNFDTVKILLEEEIHRLREINRVFRSELGLPALHPKENSLT